VFLAGNHYLFEVDFSCDLSVESDVFPARGRSTHISKSREALDLATPFVSLPHHVVLKHFPILSHICENKQ